MTVRDYTVALWVSVLLALAGLTLMTYTVAETPDPVAVVIVAGWAALPIGGAGIAWHTRREARAAELSSELAEANERENQIGRH